MDARLVIDLNECAGCDACGVTCDYFYRPHMKDHGVLALREKATFQLICRRCTQYSGVAWAESGRSLIQSAGCE